MVYYNEEIMESSRWLKKVKIKRKVELIDFEKMTKEYWEEKILNDSYAVLCVNGIKSGITKAGPVVCFENITFMKNA
jgi:REP element-mobilizing transposase RayT